MHAAYEGLLLLHVVFAFLGLAAFWVPIFARKGGTAHVRAGRLFLYAAYVVAATAVGIVVLTTISPFGTHPEARPSDPALIPAAVAELRIIELFLGYLAIVTFTSVYHGVRVMQAKRDRQSLREPLHTAAAWASILAALGILFFAVTTDHSARWIFFALSPLGVLVGAGALRYARRPAASRMAHWYEHLGAMIGGGIAFHTAFAVFGIQRFVDYSLEGVLGLVPWVLPTLIGVPAIRIWTRHYRKKFGELGGGPPQRGSEQPTRTLPGNVPPSLVWIPMLLLLWSPAPAEAQGLRHRVGLAPRVGLLVGGSRDFLDGGFGIEATGGIRWGDSPVWIRGDAGFMGLDATTPAPGVPTADNTLLTLVVGPEVEGRMGIVRPFLYLLAGYVLNVPGGGVSTADTNGSGTIGGGIGLRLRLSSTSRPALLETGLRLMDTGELSFARVDDAVDTEVAAFELRLGLLLGLP